MSHPNQHSTDPNALKAVIQNFLQERLQSKLDKLNEDDDEERQTLTNAYQPEIWIADAARRVNQIQQVTHAIKFTHPDAKGTSLNLPGNDAAGELSVGTHTIRNQYIPDVVGNAAALDVNKFLRLEVDGKTILDRAMEGDTSLQAAFSSDSTQAQSWMSAFSEITNSKGGASSHKLAKQVYWPLGNGEYHLLAPLFPTSFVHDIWSTVREDRFSDSAKAARAARRAGEAHPHGYREYIDVVIQQFGGTKPQNISQLNSERYGENYLLSSCPPNWHSESIKPPLRMDSVFDGSFGRRKEVRELTRILRDYLSKVQTVNNVRIRDKRAELVAYTRDELLTYAAEIRSLPSGWSQHPECRLNIEEQCWLDPGRSKFDEFFASIYLRGDWQDGICERFANWLNARIRDSRESLPMGDAEALEWQTVLDKELRMIRMEINTDE